MHTTCTNPATGRPSHGVRVEIEPHDVLSDMLASLALGSRVFCRSELQAAKRLSTWSIPKRGQDVSRADHPPHDEAQEHSDPEYHLRLHHPLRASEATGRAAHVPPSSCDNEIT